MLVGCGDTTTKTATGETGTVSPTTEQTTSASTPTNDTGATDAPATSNASKALEDMVADPMALMTTVWSAYRDLDASTDSIMIEFESGQLAGTPQRVEVHQDDDDNFKLRMPDIEMTVLDDRFYLEMAASPGRYLEVPHVDSVRASLNGALGRDGAALIPPTMMLRQAPTATAAIDVMGLNILKNVQLIGAELVSGSTGARVPQLNFVVDGGTATAQIDPATGFLTSLSFDAAPASVRERARKGTMTITTRDVEALETPVRFDVRDRMAVDTFANMTGLIVGMPAPDFTLPELDGGPVALSQLRGNVVVLDFWATWCGPCKQGMPLLNDFARWADSAGLPVRVYAVNTLERMPQENVEGAVRSYWTQQGFVFPTLMDFGSTMSRPYWLRSIPRTVVIDTDGNVAEVHVGFQPMMTEMLKEEVMQILRQTG